MLSILHHLLLISIHVVLRILSHQLLLMVVVVRLLVNVHHATWCVWMHTHLLIRHPLHVLKFLGALRATSICSLYKRRTIMSTYFRHIVSSVIVVRIVLVLLRNKPLSTSVCIIDKKWRLFLVRCTLPWHIESVVMILMRWKSCWISLGLLLPSSSIVVELLLSTRIMRGFSCLLSHSEISLNLLILHSLRLCKVFDSSNFILLISVTLVCYGNGIHHRCLTVVVPHYILWAVPRRGLPSSICGVPSL